MQNPNEGALSPEAKDSMDRLRESGETFEGDAKEEVKEDVKTDEVKTDSKGDEQTKGKTAQDDDKKDDSKDDSKKKDDSGKEEVVVKKRESRPTYQEGIANKRKKQKEDAEAKVDTLEKEIEKLKSKPEKKPPVSSDTAEDFDYAKHNIKDEDKGLVDAILKHRGKPPAESSEMKELLKEVKELRKSQKLNEEDHQYHKSFNKEFVPLLKGKYPDSSDDDIEKLEEIARDYYFDAKYNNMPIKDIFHIIDAHGKISVEKAKKSAESGKRGTGRAEKQSAVDYKNVSEEDFEKMTPEEQAKVIEWKRENG